LKNYLPYFRSGEIGFFFRQKQLGRRETFAFYRQSKAGFYKQIPRRKRVGACSCKKIRTFKIAHYFEQRRQLGRLSRVARWYILIPKIPNLGIFWRALQWKMYILIPFGLFYGNLVCFIVMWYVLLPFRTFPPFWYSVLKKSGNPAAEGGGPVEDEAKVAARVF
jgi:hypothetical protein